MSREYFTGNEGPRDRYGNLLYGLEVSYSILETAVTVGVAAAKLPTTPLTGRKSLTIQNLSSNMLYIGSSTVTAANGIRILPSGSMTIRVSDSVDIYGIASGAGSDVRTLEGS